MGRFPIEDRLSMLEQRLAQIEQRLGIEQQAPAAVAAPLPEPMAWTPIEPPPQVPPPLPMLWPVARPNPAPPPVAYDVPAPIPVMPYVPRAPELPPAPPKSNLEQAIGLKWAGWVGAVVLVIGAGLGIKFAYDQGWFGGLPPGLRLIFMSLVGFALIAAGEWVYRRINALSAAGLFGAGVAVLFLVSFAGHHYYRLYEQNTAYILMALSTVVGAAVAIRGNLVSIAVLALIGGNLAPVVLHDDASHLTGFLAYLMMLQAVALVLANWGLGGKWWTLRIISLATTSLWVWGVLRRYGGDETALVGFTLAYAAFFQAEMIIAAARGRLQRIAPQTTSDFAILSGTGAVFSLTVTAAAVAAVLFIFRGSTHAVRGGWVIAFCAACAVLGAVLEFSRKAQLRPLSISYRIQAAALMVLAVPVALAGAWVTVGWAVLGLAFGVLARQLRLRVARFAGVATWGLAVLHVAGRAADHADAAAHAPWLTLFGHPLAGWVVLLAALALVGHAIAWLVDPGERDPKVGSDVDLSRVTAVAATLAWVCCSLLGLPALGATLSLVLYAWLLNGGDRMAPRLGLLMHAAGVLLLATLKWAFVDLLAARLSGMGPAAQYAPVINPAMGVGVLLAASMAAFAYLRRGSLLPILQKWSGTPTGERELALGAATAVVLVMTFGLSFEIDRVVEHASNTVWPPAQLKQFFWTMLWSASSIVLVILGHRIEASPDRRANWVRGAGIAPMLLAAKWLLVDTLLWRADGVTLASVGINVQTQAGFVVIAALTLVRILSGPAPAYRRWVVQIPSFLAVLVLLWAGTLEIDRFFEKFRTVVADPHLAKEVALSVFWSLFAILSVVAGFRFRAASLRYFGLGLFALTLVKVVVIDLHQVGRGYRILSFMGLGLLLLGTSVLYGKLSPRLLRAAGEGEGEGAKG